LALALIRARAALVLSATALRGGPAAAALRVLGSRTSVLSAATAATTTAVRETATRCGPATGEATAATTTAAVGSTATAAVGPAATTSETARFRLAREAQHE
jgi:hypothetical protein